MAAWRRGIMAEIIGRLQVKTLLESHILPEAIVFTCSAELDHSGAHPRRPRHSPSPQHNPPWRSTEHSPPGMASQMVWPSGDAGMAVPGMGGGGAAAAKSIGKFGFGLNVQM